MSERVLVYGLGVAGRSMVRAWIGRGGEVVAVDDDASDSASNEMRTLGVELVAAPDDKRLSELVSWSTLVAPAPGIPEGHPLFAHAGRLDRRVATELDIAYEWEQERAGGPRPMVAVTGTDGKTTTTMLAAAMIGAAGRSTVACGNTDVPLIDALTLDVDCFVVEATSFRLAFDRSFRAEAAAWLNLAPDHLDWHESMATYEAAKARIWTAVRPADVAIGWTGDPVVMRHLGRVPCRRVTFGADHGDYRVRDGRLVSPDGDIAEIASMRRSLPHDVTNALCASALVMESGLADRRAVAETLADFVAPKHRIELVGVAEGISWFDDSKATTPHAVVTALRGFDDVVLIAGGRNKGLDLSEIASEASRIRAVVAIGDSADDIASVFEGVRPVEVADSMSDAVARARRLASSAVLLSPGCTSYDWYDGYARRGDDFARCVAGLIGGTT